MENVCSANVSMKEIWMSDNVLTNNMKCLRDHAVGSERSRWQLVL
jgi:hypothetical protein